MSFDQAAVNSLFDKIESHAMALGLFEQVNTHEPKSKPGNGLTCAIWIQQIRPVTSSGLAATSGTVSLRARLYSNMLQQPYDMIDPNLTTAASTMLAAYSADLDLGGTTRAIDLIGTHGESLSAQAGYLEMDKRTYRVMDITIPVIVNDLWTQQVVVGS